MANISSDFTPFIIILKEGKDVIKNDFNRLRCPRCNRYYLNKDRVLLDEMNTVIHQRCYTLDTLTIKERGTYREIIKRNSFFKDLI